MKLVEQGSFPIDDIEVAPRLRAVDPQWAQGMAAIFEVENLRHPIEIMRVGNSFKLIAGAHRLAAFKLLARSDIPARVYEPETETPDLEIRMAEITENIARRELSALDRAAHVAELKDVFQKLYGATHGGDRKSKKAKADQSANIALWSLGDDVASKMGLSKRTIFADAALYGAFSPALRKRLSSPGFQWLANNRAQLVALSKETADSQQAILNFFNDEAGDPPNINAALALHYNKVDITTPDERHFASFVKLWTKSSKKVRKQMLSYASKAGA